MFWIFLFLQSLVSTFTNHFLCPCFQKKKNLQYLFVYVIAIETEEDSKPKQNYHLAHANLAAKV